MAAGFVRQCKAVVALLRDAREDGVLDMLPEVRDALRHTDFAAADLLRSHGTAAAGGEGGEGAPPGSGGGAAEWRAAYGHAITLHNGLRRVQSLVTSAAAAAPAAAAATSAVAAGATREVLELRCLAVGVVEKVARLCGAAELYEGAGCWGRVGELWEAAGAPADARTATKRALACAQAAGGAAGAARVLLGGRAREAVERMITWCLTVARLEWPTVAADANSDGDPAAAAFGAPPRASALPLPEVSAACDALQAAAAMLPYYSDTAGDADGRDGGVSRGTVEDGAVTRAYADAVASCLLRGAAALLAAQEWPQTVRWLETTVALLQRRDGEAAQPGAPPADGDVAGSEDSANARAASDAARLSLAFASLEARAPALASAAPTAAAAAATAIAAMLPPSRAACPLACYVTVRCAQLQRALPAAHAALLRLLAVCDGASPQHFALVAACVAAQADATEASNDTSALYVAAAQVFSAPAAVAALRIDFITRLLAAPRYAADRTKVRWCISKVMEDHTSGRVPLADAASVRQLVAVLQRLRGLDLQREAYSHVAAWADAELALPVDGGGGGGGSAGGRATLHLTAALAYCEVGSVEPALRHATAAVAAADTPEARLLLFRVTMAAGTQLPPPAPSRRAALSALLAHPGVSVAHCQDALASVQRARAAVTATAPGDGGAVGEADALAMDALRAIARACETDAPTRRYALTLLHMYTLTAERCASAGAGGQVAAASAAVLEVADAVARCVAAAVRAPAASDDSGGGGEPPMATLLHRSMATVAHVAQSVYRLVDGAAGCEEEAEARAAAARVWSAQASLAQLAAAAGDTSLANAEALLCIQACAHVLAGEAALVAACAPGAARGGSPAWQRARQHLELARTRTAEASAALDASVAVPSAAGDSAGCRDGTAAGDVLPLQQYAGALLEHLGMPAGAKPDDGAGGALTHAARAYLAACIALLRLQAAAVVSGLARAEASTPAPAAAATLRGALEDTVAAVPPARGWPIGMVQSTAELLASPLPDAGDVAVKLLLAALGREVELQRVAARRGAAPAGAASAASGAGSARAGEHDAPAAYDVVAGAAADAWAFAPRYSSDRLAVLGRVASLVSSGNGTRAGALTGGGGAFPYAVLDELVVGAYNDGWSLLQLHMVAPAERFIGWAVGMLEPLATLARAALGAAVRADTLRLEVTALREAARISALAAEVATGGRAGGGSGARAWEPWAPALGHAAAAVLAGTGDASARAVGSARAATTSATAAAVSVPPDGAAASAGGKRGRADFEAGCSSVGSGAGAGGGDHDGGECGGGGGGGTAVAVDAH